VENNLKKIKNDIKALLDEGDSILAYIQIDASCQQANQTYEEVFKEKSEQERKMLIEWVNNFNIVHRYETWYSKSLKVIQSIQPDRINDFKLLYKNEKRKELNHGTYTLSDYLIRLANGFCGPKNAVPKFDIQLGILRSTYNLFDTSVANIRELLAADLFDSEIDSASELLKKKFYRASGVIAGVVLEKHLKSICIKHGIKITKKNIGLSELTQLLYESKIYELETHREMELYTELRNLCSHKKNREPNAEDVQKLISGVNSVIKSIF
jgi:HEPN domain-containing protein